MKIPKAEVIESIRGWKQGDCDADEILQQYGDLIMTAVEAMPDLTKVPPPFWSPMGFNTLCKGCTDAERKQLARYLAMLRMEATLALGTAPQKTGEQ